MGDIFAFGDLSNEELLELFEIDVDERSCSPFSIESCIDQEYCGYESGWDSDWDKQSADSADSALSPTPFQQHPLELYRIENNCQVCGLDLNICRKRKL